MSKLNLAKLNLAKLNLSSINQRLLSFIICSLLSFSPLSLAVAEQSKDPQDATTAKKDDGASVIKKPIAITKQHKNDLKHYLPTEQVKPLLAGPDDYITLVKPHTSSNSKGVAILIPEWQQGATNPKAIEFLRNALPKEGWSTIAVQPNNKPENYPSNALTLEQQKEENKLLLDEYKQKLSAMHNAIMNIAKEYPGIVLVIVQGNNAAFLVDLYSQEGSQLPNALIMLSSYRQTSQSLINGVNTNFAQQLALTELPVLDLFLQHDNSLVLAKAEQRKSIAKQEMKVYYRQRQLNNSTTGYYPEEELLTQINSWLKAIGW